MSKITIDRLYPVWHRMLYSWTHMPTVGVKGLKVENVKALINFNGKSHDRTTGSHLSYGITQQYK